MVHDAAVPLGVDGAGFRASGVMDMQSERRNHDASEGEDKN
jgi:hypothetical protein